MLYTLKHSHFTIKLEKNVLKIAPNNITVSMYRGVTRVTPVDSEQNHVSMVRSYYKKDKA